MFDRLLPWDTVWFGFAVDTVAKATVLLVLVAGVMFLIPHRHRLHYGIVCGPLLS